MDCSPPGSSVHFPVKNTGVVAISFSRESSRPKDHASPALASLVFTTGPAGKSPVTTAPPQKQAGQLPTISVQASSLSGEATPTPGRGLRGRASCSHRIRLELRRTVGMNVFSSNKPTDTQRNGGLKSHQPHSNKAGMRSGSPGF